MKFKDITLTNISNFLEGYSKWFLDNLLPNHTKEQILWTMQKGIISHQDLEFLLEFTKAHLTTESIAKYVLEQ